MEKLEKNEKMGKLKNTEKEEEKGYYSKREEIEEKFKRYKQDDPLFK
jgi:hypothetical protein